VWVLNKGIPFSDRFNGEPYNFPTGEPQEIPPEAAKLFFGWGEDAKDRALRRLGWAKTAADVGAAIERLNQFSFHLERPGHSAAPVGETPPAVTSLPAGGSDPQPVEAEPEVVIRTRPTQVNILNKLAGAHLAAG
jgi:hypothetical protein